ncbi:MAG TPA: 16S rRNA (cytosine(1402)-N(4))-methyltransferase RsmH [Candidatus Saccharimonadales bacterium]|nr:16S rRNA (cytosine(1402)-N(4))-methyltransferase RsmH [Candidatus Saccharimonadales bacterium]
MHQNDIQLHLPVLLHEVLQYLDPSPGESYLDVTAGYGGHASAVLERTGSTDKAVLVDRDQRAMDVLTEKFGAYGAKIMHNDFLTATQRLIGEGRGFDLILADLGVSSPHLNEAARGFSIGADGPLDMRMDQTQQLTAADIVNRYSHAQLADILTQYGEEPKAKRIATLIVENRPITTTVELARIASRAWSGHSKVHPATRTFQAIRIAVNNELALLEQGLPLWMQLLNPGGRIAVISFHSLEDRLVKKAFSEAGGDRYDATLRLLTKHPVTASEDEIVFNPRARSAKLRAAAKIKK